MRFTTFDQGRGPRLGLLDHDQAIDLQAWNPAIPADLRSALALDLCTLAHAALASDAPRLPLAGLSFAPLVPEPGKIVCLGLNYHDHAKEGGRERPDYPWFFLRTPSSLLGHGQAARLPRVSERLDYEAELAVVIGRTVPRHVPAAQALAYVFGYACFNDLSVRDYQKRTPQWTIGKNFDATGGFGPTLVTADTLPPGAAGLSIRCRVNGQTVQEASTADMLWGVADTIALLSEAMTLEPGDVIAMGTPAGVGQSRTPPLWLRAGDRVEVEIEGIGVLLNPVQHEA